MLFRSDNVYQVQSLQILQSNIAGVGTTTIKRVYARVSVISSAGLNIGIATTALTSVTFDANIAPYTFDSTQYTFDRAAGIINSGLSTVTDNYGSFSWGKIILSYRSTNNTYNFYGNNGVGGISTSAIVTRANPLKYSSYIPT